ncbi:hypothetical protein AAG906_038466 [Vitis piasezkii]
MPVTSPGGRCWFGVELKMFEISIEEHKGKVSGKIFERGPKFSSRIRFGGKGLSLLLEGVESCYGLKEIIPFRKFWSEGDRDYSLELRSNRVGRFLFCVVRDVDNKRLSLAFPEGRGFIRGYVDRDTSSLRVCPAPCDAVWLEIEKETLDRNEELLGRCLVSLYIFGEEVSLRGLEPLVGDSWLWMKTQPNIGTSSGPEWSLVPLVSLCNSSWKHREDEVAPLHVEGSVGFLPSSLVPPQPEKLPPSVLGSGAPASDKTVAAAPLSHAYEVEMGQRLDAMAHSGLACVNFFGPRQGKAQVSTTQGNPFKPIDPAPSNDLRQESPSYSPRRRRGTPDGTPQMEALPQMEVSPPINEPPHPRRCSQSSCHLLLLLHSKIRGLRGKGDLALVCWNRCQGSKSNIESPVHDA